MDQSMNNRNSIQHYPRALSPSRLDHERTQGALDNGQRRQRDDHRIEALRLDFHIERLHHDDPSFNLWDLQLPSNLIPGFYHSLSEAMKGNTRLAELALSNAILSEADAHALVGGINQSKLRSLAIVRPIRARPVSDSERVWKVILLGLQSSQTIQALHIYQLPVDAVEGLGLSLPKIKNLRILTLNRLVLNQCGAQALARGIGQSHLESLTLLHSIREAVGFDAKGVWQILMRGVRFSETLLEVSLPSIPVEGVPEIAKLLSSVSSLCKLYMDSLEVTVQGAESLERGLSRSNLHSVTIGRSIKERPAGDSGRIWKALFQGIKNAKMLRELRLPPISCEDIVGLGEILPKMSSLRSLELERVILTEAGAQNLARGIQQSKLESFSIRHSIRERPVNNVGRISQILYRGIQASTTIQELGLADDHVRDLVGYLAKLQPKRRLTVDIAGLTERKVQSFVKSICQSNTQRVELRGWMSVQQGQGHSLPLVYKAGPQQHAEKDAQPTQTLRVSSFNGSIFSALISQILSRSSKLIKLELSNCDLGDGGMIQLAHGLHQNTSVTHLILQDCNVGDVGLEVLVTHSFKHNTILSLLQLDSCGISDVGVKSLIQSWRATSSLHSLSLVNNFVGVLGLRLILQAISDRPILRMLDLSSNINIGYEGLLMLGSNLPHQPHMTDVRLFGCTCWTECINRLAPQQAAEQATLDGMKRNLRIKNIDLHGNSFSWLVETEIELYTRLNRRGRYLLLTKNEFPNALWSRVFAKCQDQGEYAASLVFFYLREQPNLFISSSPNP